MARDCETENCLEKATSYPDGHQFCFECRDKYSLVEAQESCKKMGLDTVAKQKAYFKKNVNRAFRRL